MKPFTPIQPTSLASSDELLNDLMEFNREYSDKLKRDQLMIGKILHCHLLIEHYMTDYLKIAHPAISNWKELRLNFDRKLIMANDERTSFRRFGKGIKALNIIRNRYAHNLDSHITEEDLKPIRDFMEDWKEAGRPLDNPEDLIEAFTIIVCGFLHSMTKAITRCGDGLTGFFKHCEEEYNKQKLSGEDQESS